MSNTQKVCEKLAETYQERLHRDKYASAALSVQVNGRNLQQPALSELADHLWMMDDQRFTIKGKYMTADHLKQEAVKWARQRDHSSS